MKTPLTRFEEKYIKSPVGCWVWTAAKDQWGYGMFHYNSRTQRANRVSWQLYRGKIPDGLFVCHACDTPYCVNPEHLFLGTSQDNNTDMVQKARNTPMKGTTNGRSRLSEAEVLQIRAATGRTQQSLAEQFGVTRQLISDIRLRKKWRHL